MDAFGKQNLQNIRTIFRQKTGVNLHPVKNRFVPVKMAGIMVAILICGFSMTAFAWNIFSSLRGDELSLSASYQGDGIVSIQVENKSDKQLKFQPQLKLMRWSTGEEIEPVSDDVIFSGTEFLPHSSGTMTVDLSQAYDIEALEQPVKGDNYYFVLTNNDFLFGQDWMCTVHFSEPIEMEIEYPEEIVPVETDAELSEQIAEQLKPYFAEYLTNPDDYRKRAEEYFAQCSELLAKINGNVVSPVSPLDFMVDIPIEELPVFDDTVPVDKQHLLIGENRFILDGYNLPVSASKEDSALVISAFIPQYRGQTDGGASLPLVYLFTYETNAIQNLNDYAFVRGRLMAFEQMENYKVYQDEKYTCYDMTDLFYTDLHEYTETILSQRSDIWLDNQVWERIENIYEYYRNPEILKNSFIYRP